MSSGDLYSAARRAAKNAGGGYNSFSVQQHQFSSRSSVAGEQDEAGQIRLGKFMGKRSLVENQENYLRNVKAKPDYEREFSAFPVSGVGFAAVPSVSPEFLNWRDGFPVVRQQGPQPQHLSWNLNMGSAVIKSGVLGSLEVPGDGAAEKSSMDHRLRELEKELLNDDDDGEAVSVVTENEWSEAIRDLIGPAQKVISPSPTSPSSCSTITSVSPPPPCHKQTVIDAAEAISEGKLESAAEILMRFPQEAKSRGNCKQKLAAYMVSALKSRLGGGTPALAEVQSEEQAVSTQMLYCVSPCFKLSFMAANLAVLEATSELGLRKIHVLEFELGQGGQYFNLLHTLAANAKLERKTAPFVTITAFPYAGAGEEKLRSVGQNLNALALKTGVPFCFRIRDFDTRNLSREKLELQSDEALAVNFAFKLHKLPDESVTVENPRDELLRRVKTLSPAVVTVSEQDLNTNTAPIATRARDVYDYYAALLESLDSTTAAGDNPDRARIDSGLATRITNSVACEGCDRLDRCEVFGKWRARMSMAGFRPLVLSPRAVDSLRSKLNFGTRVNPGFTLREESGGLCFGWKEKTLTFASAWR